jgi:hypothetical protein
MRFAYGRSNEVWAAYPCQHQGETTMFRGVSFQLAMDEVKRGKHDDYPTV